MVTNRADWLAARLDGIGASEAAAVMGYSPYMSNVELWELKTRRQKQMDISGKSYVKYGIDAEPYLRELFALDFPQYVIYYDQFGMIRNNPDCPFAFATLDGELTERETGRRGVLEIKTTEIMNAGQWIQWNNRIPDNYYLQVLHQLLATGYDFAILKAQIKHRHEGEITLSTRHYLIERADVAEDIAALAQEEKQFWMDVKNDRKPALKLPEI